MAQFIEYAVDGGQSIVVQVEDSAAGPVTRGIGGQSITARASQTCEDAISRVRPAGEAVVAQLQSLASAPDEVEFGLTLSAEAGTFIAAASAEANFKISLTWRRHAAREAK
jgi:Trypsin-co-occurring domain 1